jgi:Zn-dependent protease with chaperone function
LPQFLKNYKYQRTSSTYRHLFEAKKTITKMTKFLGSAASDLFITHPAPENRQKALKKLIPKMMPFYKAAK